MQDPLATQDDIAREELLDRITVQLAEYLNEKINIPLMGEYTENKYIILPFSRVFAKWMFSIVPLEILIFIVGYQGFRLDDAEAISEVIMTIAEEANFAFFPPTIQEVILPAIGTFLLETLVDTTPPQPVPPF